MPVTPPPTGKPSARQQKANKAIRERRARFAKAHKKGMKALEKADFAAFGEAIVEERQIIKEHRTAAKKAMKKR